MPRIASGTSLAGRKQNWQCLAGPAQLWRGLPKFLATLIAGTSQLPKHIDKGDEMVTQSEGLVLHRSRDLISWEPPTARVQSYSAPKRRLVRKFQMTCP